ncbi:unnamed protein product [Ectocarpus sp. 8 AP-2014]
MGYGEGGKGRALRDLDPLFALQYYMRKLAFGVYKRIGTQIDSMVQGSETQLR